MSNFSKQLCFHEFQSAGGYISLKFQPLIFLQRKQWTQFGMLKKCIKTLIAHWQKLFPRTYINNIYFLSCRSCRLYNPNSYRCCYNINKLILNNSQKATEIGEVCCVLKIFFIIILYTILFSGVHCISKSAEKLPKAEWLWSFVIYNIGLGNWVHEVPDQFTGCTVTLTGM